MSTTQAATQSLKYDATGFEQFLAARQEPTWLTSLRRQSWRDYEDANWPDRKLEDWMRSDLRGFKLDRYPLAGNADPTTIEDVEIPQRLSDGIAAAGLLRTFDGQTVLEHLEPIWKEKGVLFGDLSRLALENPDLVQPYIYSVVNPNQDRFAMLHAATWSGGQLLYVPRGVCVDQPFHVAAAMSDGGTDSGHTIIVIEEGAEATFLYEANSCSESSAGLHLGGVEIIVKPGGHLRYVNLQDWGRGVWHFAHQRATVARDATLQWTVAALGSRFSQVSQSVSLIGKGAYSQVNGVLFTQDKQQLTYNTFQHHQAPYCRSDFLYKAALQDESRTVWRGMIAVDPDAQKTDGYQRNDNLMLSDHARADSIPGLEILADDVRCTHGSTSGKVDEELIFYVQSRGFTRREAVRLVVTGFFQQIFDRITIESVREALGQSIARQVREVN